MTIYKKLSFIMPSLLFLLITLSRLLLFPQLYFDQDEVWSIWQASGKLGEVFTRNPFDFPAGFYVILYAWHHLAGISPFAMRVFLVLIYLINVAFMFVLAQRFFRHPSVGYYAVLAYAALGYIVYLSVLLRPYPLVMMTFPMTFYAVLRYFDAPNLKSALWVALAMACMWYVALTAIFAYLVIGLYTLMRDIRLLRLWILPGGIAFILALPEIWSKLNVVIERTSQVFENNTLPPLPLATYQRFVDYFGSASSIWFGIIIVAILISLWHQQASKRYLLFFIVWAVGGVVLLYVSHARTNFFQFARYGWWLAPAIALLIAQSIAVLPHSLRRLCGVGLIALLFVPQNVGDYKEPIPNFEATFRWLQDHYSSGDAVIVDENCRCQRPEVWEYYERVYFPSGLNIVDHVSLENQRVWYFRTIDTEHPLTFSTVNESRVASVFFGNPGFFLQLYVAPPDPVGIVFENGLRFHGYEVLTNHTSQTENAMIYRPEGADLKIRLWWSIDASLSQDYSVGLQILEDSWGLYTQDDQSPQPIFLQPNLYDYGDPPATMSTWEPNIIYVEERVITLPYASRLRRTEFTVYMTVYQWWDGVRLSAENTNTDDLLPLFKFTVVAW